jgi:hypothetical protein
VTASTVAHRPNLWPWLSAYVVIGVLAGLSLISLGWILLGPVVLIVGITLFSSTARRGVSGLALGVGLVFVFFAATGGDHSYVVGLLVMGTSLIVVGILELVRRTWVAPR